MPRKTINLTIDETPISVAEGTTIMEAAEQLGIYIPRLCYHPDLSLAGSCRVCVVDVKGMGFYMASCSVKVWEGMEVQTNAPEIRQALQEEVSYSPLDEPSAAGELARQALLLLAEDPEIGPNLEQLIEHPSEKFGFEIEMAITVAVLIALQTHVRFERKPSGKWKLVIEKKPTQKGLLKALVRGILSWKG